MSNHTGYGTLTANASTGWKTVSGWVTVATHGTWDTATMTWNFKGVDGVERGIVAGSDNITAQAYTVDHMVNFFFGTDVKLRGTLSSVGAGTDLDWQIMSNPFNRTD